VESGLLSCELWTNHTSQPLERSSQIFGLRLVQLDGNRDIKQSVSALLELALPMSEQTVSEDPGKAHERPTIADRAFATPAVADQLTIKAEDRIPDRQATSV
jgi:hypothetical protein